GRRIVDRAADQRLHPHRAAYENRFKVEPFLAVKAFHLRNAKLHFGHGNGARRETYLLELRRSRTGGNNKNNQRSDCSSSLLHVRAVSVGLFPGVTRLAYARSLTRRPRS